MLGGQGEGGVWGVVVVWGCGSEGYMHGKRVIEIESKHRRKIITCQAWVVVGNELHLT